VPSSCPEIGVRPDNSAELTFSISRALAQARRAVMALCWRFRFTRRLLGCGLFTRFPTLAQASANRTFSRLKVLRAAERIVLASPGEDRLISCGRYFRDGVIQRPEIFVGELRDAWLCADNGVVCTGAHDVLVDIEPRRIHFQDSVRRKPWAMITGFQRRRRGLYSTINGIAAGNYYHWMIDCLPKLHSLALAEPLRTVTLLMPESLGEVQRESLAAMLPENFRVEFCPPQQWLRLETFLVPSLVSGYYCGWLPPDYYDFLRQSMFRRYGLAPVPGGRERLYVSRSRARFRRVENEPEVERLLKAYGFRMVYLEDLSFREQVELFHRAGMVIGASGAGLNLLVFCAQIPVVVLHPEAAPANFFHTMAKGLGQDYHFVTHSSGPDDNFTADVAELQRVLEEEVGLHSPQTPAAAR
jgi:hypothetical protein